MYTSVLACKVICSAAPPLRSLTLRCGRVGGNGLPRRFILSSFIHMRKLLSTARKINLLYALELLDETVRGSPIAGEYIGTTTELAVSETIRRAKRRFRSKEIVPRPDQLELTVS